MKPIGIIHSPFTDPENMPIQPVGATGNSGTVEVFQEFSEGLKDLDGFSHIYLIYEFHKQEKEKLRVVPFMDSEEHGIFATRSPARPNKIGISIVKLLSVEENILTVENIDILDETPLLDIKPYIKNFDFVQDSTTGWMKSSVTEVKRKRSDNRFK